MEFRPRPTTKYNEAFFRGMKGPGPTAVGIVVILLILAGLYLAFAKRIPFTDRGYELNATFSNAANIRPKSPVRIAGVNVGEVIDVERKGELAAVRFTVTEEGRPIHDDASVDIRPRIFLEGNFFLDLRPGSPSAPEIGDNGSIPLSRTGTAVQLDEILTALQSDSRLNLQLLLEGFGTGLTYLPTPVDDQDQDPEIQGESAATALNRTFEYGESAGRDTAIVNDALRGTTGDDLSKLIAGAGKAFSALADRERQLQELVSNFDTFSGALASESANLSETIALLEPTLQTANRSLIDLNAALPALRGFAIALEPGVAELPETIRAGRPWLEQALPLLSRRELGGLASLLEQSTPNLASANRETLRLLPEITTFSRCVDENLIPAGNVVLQDSFAGNSFNSGQPNYREFLYTSVGVAAESANFDGNGPYVRFQPGGGPVPVQTPNPAGSTSPIIPANIFYGDNISEPLGVRPVVSGAPPAFRSDVPCHNNAIPNYNGPAAAVGPPNPRATTP
jgi:ABC-type transporter Mla subunit MlaD